MKEKFKDTRLSGKIRINIRMDNIEYDENDEDAGYWITEKMAVVNYIISICEEYLANGDTLTLRQLYYQLVSKDLIPNHDKVYKKIGSIKDDIVYSGLVDWRTFEDRGRVPSRAYFEDNVKGALERTVDFYNLDKQRGQGTHIEVWTEKDAISGILRTVTDEYTIRLAVNKGYTSSTAIYNSYERFVQSILRRKKVKILYFGDHDPSGLDMIRDIKTRLEFMFITGDRLRDKAHSYFIDNDYTIHDVTALGEDYEAVSKLVWDDDFEAQELLEQGKVRIMLDELELFEVVQIGLTMKQIEEYNPPHNPAKMTDPRAKWYIRQFGAVSWEVDALPPKLMREIVKTSIVENMDDKEYQLVLEKEQEDIKEITKIIGDVE